MDRTGASGGPGIVPHAGGLICRTDVELLRQRLLGSVRGIAFQFRAAHPVSHWCSVGGARGFAAAVGIFVVLLDQLDPRTALDKRMIIYDDKVVQYYSIVDLALPDYREVIVSHNPKLVQHHVERFEYWKRLAIPFDQVEIFKPYLKNS